MDVIFQVVWTECALGHRAKSFGNCRQAHRYSTWWHDDGTVERIHDALPGKDRASDHRDVEPSAGLPAAGRSRRRGEHPRPRRR
ncbi:hypothetical protein [Streptomyces sp. NPDC006285]|uniref:hypothetical protein n=1 Tax=Streptomyces sp. NPDC006285 TaxID=3364742 RepID=UPI003683B223